MHATHTNPTMSEDHANRALCPKKMKVSRQLVTRKIAYPMTPSRRNGSAHPVQQTP
jgi:hypothetical protein